MSLWLGHILRQNFVFLYFALVASLYFLSSAGIVSTNDGAHFNLVKAILEDRSLAISQYLHFTVNPEEVLAENRTDISFYKGRYYSDRAPGTAFLAMPFYLLGKLMGSIAGVSGLMPSEIGATSLSVVSGALSALLVYRLSLLLGASRRGAMMTSFLFAFATLNWKYSTSLFSHAPSASLILLASYAALKMVQSREPPFWLFPALGAMLGYSALVEYQNLLLALPIVVYLLWKQLWTKRRFVAFALAYALALSPLPLYNYLAFDNPFTIAYTYQAIFPHSRSLSASFATPLGVGTRGLILGDTTPMGDKPTARGLLETSPVLVLGLWGWWLLFRRRRSEALLFAALFLLGFLVAAKYTTWFGDHDTRYILTVTPYLAIPVSLWIDALLSRYPPSHLLFWPLLLVSLLRSWWMVMTFFNHYGDGHPLNSLPDYLLRDPWGGLVALFPSMERYPIFFLGLLVVGLCLLLYQRLAAERKGAATTEAHP